MKSKKKIISIVACCALVACMAIGGTFAYLTDTADTATNTFSVGEVKIELQEPNYQRVDNMVPNQEAAKDPLIKNVSATEDNAIVFMKVTVPVANVTAVSDAGVKGEKANQELFFFKQEADGIGTHANNFGAKWIELSAKETGTDMSGATRTYVFGYSEKLAKDASTDALFDKVQVKNIIEDEVTAAAEQNIVVEAYAIQGDEVLSGNADLTDTLDATNLGAIWDIYFAQNA